MEGICRYYFDNGLYLIIGTAVILPDYPLSDNLFDAINHAMAGQATGGFSTLDNSIAEYNSAGMEILHILPMFLGALSFPFFTNLSCQKTFACFGKIYRQER
ncbi:MAG: hypothetical protein IPM77_11575 [Crocinitomicaceae bacterium]|nr:hypothetical protein [Crocinitomicaceae bacterium]